MAKTTTTATGRRLAQAQEWLTTYTGKNIVRSYAKYFAVDLACAIRELRMLGVVISNEYEQAVKHSIAAHAMQQQQKKAATENKPTKLPADSDEYFAYIAGYTSGGAPYGITWNEQPCFPVSH